MLDVTDTFDAFHRVVSALWREFGGLLQVGGDEDSVSFDMLVDQLEVDLFLPACARRLRALTGEDVEPEEVALRIRLVAEEGEVLPGAAGRYHSHAFHPADPAGDVPNAVLAANLMSLSRAGLRLQIGSPTQPSRSGFRRDLPVH